MKNTNIKVSLRIMGEEDNLQDITDAIGVSPSKVWRNGDYIIFSIDFKIVIENEKTPAIYFKPEFVEFAAKIGARFDVDIYVN